MKNKRSFFGENHETKGDADDGQPSGSYLFSAFTIAEPGEMLPIGSDLYTFRTSIKGHWTVAFEQYTAQEADTEADARAKMLVYLFENRLI